MIEFIRNIWCLDMFRTALFQSQERLQAVCWKFGIGQYAYYSTRPAVTKQRLDVSSSTRITTYQICNIQLVSTPEVGSMRSETCRDTKCYE